MTTVADSYRQEKSRLSTGEEYLTQQKFGLIPDEMKEQLGLVEDIKKQNSSMLSFMNVPTADDVFLFDRPFQNRKDIRGITGLSYAPISKGGRGRGGKGAVPHPWIYTEAQFEDKPWEIPASDPKWQNVVSTESKISVAPGSKAPTLMHEQIHLDIRDLVMSGDLSEDDYRVISAGSADNPHFTEHALINYLVLQSGIELGSSEKTWIEGLLENYRTKSNLSEEELEVKMEGMVDLLNDANRSRIDYGGQQDRLQQESTRRYQESLSPDTLEKLNTPKMQVVPGYKRDPLAEPFNIGHDFWAVDYDPNAALWRRLGYEYNPDTGQWELPEKAIGGTGYQHWDVGADYVPSVSSVMPDIRARDLYTPPGPSGEASFRASLAVPSILQAGNGLVPRPVTTAAVDQPPDGELAQTLGPQRTLEQLHAEVEAERKIQEDIEWRDKAEQELWDDLRKEDVKPPEVQIANIPEIMPPGYGESIGLLPPQGYGESIGVMPPQGYGESIGVLPPRGYGESIGSLNPIDYPQAEARAMSLSGLNYATEPVQLPGTTFSNFRATGPEPLYGRGGLPPSQSMFPQIEVDRGTEGLTIPSEMPEIKTRPEMQVMPTEPGSQDLLSPRVQEMMDDLINSIAGWSDEEIANIYGVSVEYVQQRRQEIQPQEAEVTQETVPQPSLIDRLKGLLPKGRTESGMVEPPAGPGYLPGKQSVGEAMSTPLDLSEAALEAQVSPEVRSTQFAPSTLVPEPITRSFGQEPIQVSPERPPMSLAPQSDIRTPISSVRDIPESTPTRAYEPFPLSSIQLSGPEYQQWDVGAEEGLEGNLVDVGTYNLEKKTTKAMLEEPWYENRALLAPEAADAFNEMQEEYKKGHKDKDIPIESAFRSKLHNDALIKIGLSAVKTSDHLKGLALDITDKHANAWMKKYGNDYGWHFSHYKGNTTHFEFIGVQN